MNRPLKTTFAEHLPAKFILEGGMLEDRLLPEYGAMFVAKGVALPDRLAFEGESEVDSFQERAGCRSAVIGDFTMELQPPALESLLAAVAAAERAGISICPRGNDSGRRGYADTVKLWKSRVIPATEHWLKLGRIGADDEDVLINGSIAEQIARVFELEKHEIWFSKDLSKSIVYSVAPPGTSQHLSMLAFDVAEFDDETVRRILAEHCWYQTVMSDLPHFTYLGITEADLPAHGLKNVEHSGRRFWVPDV